MNRSRTGLLCVVSGPSGSGKTTLCRAAGVAEGCYYTVSATTRPARAGEVDGTDYHFFSEDEFRRRLAANEFLESASVYGRLYGTLKSEVVPHLERGREVIMDLDTQGAAQIRSLVHPLVRAAHFDVFILPPTLVELQRRLAGRHSDAPDMQQHRLASALNEISHWREYAYTLVSGTREDDLALFRCLLAAERMRSSRVEGSCESVS